MNDEQPDLKKELKKKKREFVEVKEKSKKRTARATKKIDREKEEKIKKASRDLEHNLNHLDQKHEESVKKLRRRQKKLNREHIKKEEEARHKNDKRHKTIHKEAEKAKRIVIDLSEKEVHQARKEFLRIKARAYSRRRKILNALQFVGLLYMFILSIVVLKDVALALSSGAVDSITNAVDGPASAFGAGWLTSFLAQSASVVAILTNTLVGSGVITFDTAFYVLLGLTLGNAVTPILASLVIKTEHHWDLRHGFELGLANIIYALFLVVLVFLIQIFTGLFTNAGYAVNDWAQTMPTFAHIPSLLDVVTDPVIWFFRIDQAPAWAGFIIGIFLLVFSLGRVGKSMFVFMGGKRHTRALIEKHMNTYWKAFLIGLGLTIIIPSSSLLVTLMVPLAITRIVTLRQAIPYLIGTNVGTFIDVLLASFANAQGFAIAGGLVLTLMSAFGILFVVKNVGVTWIYKLTRYIALHKMIMRKSSIVKFLLVFALIPAVIVALGQVLPI